MWLRVATPGLESCRPSVVPSDPCDLPVKCLVIAAGTTAGDRSTSKSQAWRGGWAAASTRILRGFIERASLPSALVSSTDSDGYATGRH